jgi:23S rRNA (adenine1618-N6)-methyltransferase
MVIMAKEGQAAYSCFMHPRNRHQSRYDLKALAKGTPELLSFIMINQYGDESLDFSDKDAVKALNRAILKSTYGIEYWDIPSQFLCPPIPGRADYIHSASDLFESKQNLKVLDIGTGANCIYPLLGVKEYLWQVVGSDINPEALNNAKKIIEENKLTSSIELRHQTDKSKIFHQIIRPDEKYDLTICNPPFHASLSEASKGSQRKWNNLGKRPLKSELNFGGQGAELWCPGGERSFILQMIDESAHFKTQVTWYTTLVSKEVHLPILIKTLEKYKTVTKTIEMSQGQKISRLLCWTYKL